MERNLFSADIFNPLKVIDKAVQTIPVTVYRMATDLSDHFQLMVKISVGCIPKLCGVFLTHYAPPEYGHSAGMKDVCNPHKNPARI